MNDSVELTNPPIADTPADAFQRGRHGYRVVPARNRARTLGTIAAVIVIGIVLDSVLGTKARQSDGADAHGVVEHVLRNRSTAVALVLKKQRVTAVCVYAKHRIGM